MKKPSSEVPIGMSGIHPLRELASLLPEQQLQKVKGSEVEANVGTMEQEINDDHEEQEPDPERGSAGGRAIC